jgi:hypothetical protein
VRLFFVLGAGEPLGAAEAEPWARGDFAVFCFLARFVADAFVVERLVLGFAAV